MKILHIIGSMDPASGGPCQGIRNSNTAMNNLGSSREVVCLDDPNASFIGHDDFPIHALGPNKSMWKYTPKLKPWLLDNLSRFDVVIINGIWLHSSYVAWKVVKALKKKNKKLNIKFNIPRIYVMPHGMLDPYFQNAPSRRLKAVRNWIYWQMIEKNIVNNADAVLFTCEMELQLAKKTFFNYHPKKEINVGYGIIPPPMFSSNMYQSFLEKCPQLKNERDPYLLFFSRIHEKKGTDLLIDAYSIIIQEAKKSKISIPKLVIAGPGIDSLFGKKLLKKVNSSADLSNSILFPGMLMNDAKWGALYGCEAFVLPSHQENFGIAVVEALACGKPVLISNQINIYLEIKNAGSGLVAPDTIVGVTDLLTQWLKLNTFDRDKMSKNAFEVFKKFFHIEPNSKIFLKALDF